MFLNQTSLSPPFSIIFFIIQSVLLLLQSSSVVQGCKFSPICFYIPLLYHTAHICKAKTDNFFRWEKKNIPKSTLPTQIQKQQMMEYSQCRYSPSRHQLGLGYGVFRIAIACHLRVTGTAISAITPFQLLETSGTCTLIISAWFKLLDLYYQKLGFKQSKNSNVSIWYSTQIFFFFFLSVS